VIPTAATNSGRASWTLVHGNPGFGRPCGRAPTVFTSRSNTAVTRTHDRDEHRGYLAHETRKHEEHGQRGETDRDRRAVALVKAVDERPELVDEAVRVGREPTELGQLTDDDRVGKPVHVADLHLLREEVSDEAELGDTEADLAKSDHEGHHAGQRDRPRRIVSCHHKRRDRGEAQRSERRVWPQHQDSARSHDRVPNETGDRRVQPRDRGKPGQLCVGHALGHEIAARTTAATRS